MFKQVVFMGAAAPVSAVTSVLRLEGPKLEQTQADVSEVVAVVANGGSGVAENIPTLSDGSGAAPITTVVTRKASGAAESPVVLRELLVPLALRADIRELLSVRPAQLPRELLTSVLRADTQQDAEPRSLPSAETREGVAAEAQNDKLSDAEVAEKFLLGLEPPSGLSVDVADKVLRVEENFRK